MIEISAYCPFSYPVTFFCLQNLVQRDHQKRPLWLILNILKPQRMLNYHFDTILGTRVMTDYNNHVHSVPTPYVRVAKIKGFHGYDNGAQCPGQEGDEEMKVKQNYFWSWDGWGKSASAGSNI